MTFDAPHPTAPAPAAADAGVQALAPGLIPEWALTPQNARAVIRRGAHRGLTGGMAPGFGQGNLMILPRSWADEFLAFCRANPVSCPLIGMTSPGSSLVPMLGDDVDLRTDLPMYRVWRDGVLVEARHDISEIWQDDFVGFVLGCSFSFESALQQAGLQVRHIDENKGVPMFRTNIATVPVGRLHGPMVVSMRPYTPAETQIAIDICARLPGAHGAPVHIGSPDAIGIADVMCPDEGDPTEIRAGEQAVFWACGVTPQQVAMAAKPPLCITHAPGHMLVTDVLTENLRLL